MLLLLGPKVLQNAQLQSVACAKKSARGKRIVYLFMYLHKSPTGQALLQAKSIDKSQSQGHKLMMCDLVVKWLPPVPKSPSSPCADHTYVLRAAPLTCLPSLRHLPSVRSNLSPLPQPSLRSTYCPSPESQGALPQLPCKYCSSSVSLLRPQFVSPFCGMERHVTMLAVSHQDGLLMAQHPNERC